MTRLSTFFLLAGSLALAGCGQEPASVPPVIESVAHAQKLADGTYEVQLRYSVTSSGGPCLSKDMFKTWTSYSTNWLYVKSLDGVQSADQIVVTTDAGKKEWPYAKTNLQGTVSFTDAVLTVQLQGPGYHYKRNVESGIVSYQLNGTYHISESSQ
jgi:hypothetical protein